MGNLCPGMPRSSRKKRSEAIRFADHPTTPVTSFHKLVAIPGTGGRDQSESLVAINRNSWSRSPGARSLREAERLQPPPLVVRPVEIEAQRRQSLDLVPRATRQPADHLEGLA
jgi:hypothetical protein